jgi:hypothetical protein
VRDWREKRCLRALKKPTPNDPTRLAAPSFSRVAHVHDMSNPSIELTEQELAVTRTTLCALLAADTGVLATLDDAAREWLQGLLASGASEELPN